MGICSYCHNPIRWIQVDGNRIPKELNSDDNHRCPGSTNPESVSTFFSDEENAKPKTFRTNCPWECGELVWYHTNGYGDSVYLDELGDPWPMHECYREYLEVKKQSISSPNSINGFAPLKLPRINLDLKVGEQVKISGYLDINEVYPRRIYESSRIFYNLYSHKEYEPRLSNYDSKLREIALLWVRILISNGESVFGALCPKNVADLIKNKSLLNVTIMCVKYNAIPLLLVKSISSPLASRNYDFQIIPKIGFSCDNCGKLIGNEDFPNWGFYDDSRILCNDCAAKMLKSR